MIKIEITEGLGSYKGVPRNGHYNPNGRMGALLQAFKNDVLVYATQNASTLPDSISDWYAGTFNGGDGIPCIYEGTYEVYTKMHMGKHKALEVGKSTESVPVIRNDKESTSTGINLHYRRANDPTYSQDYASSIGCITVLEDDLMEMFMALGITSFKGEYVGQLAIKRTLTEELYENYKGYYPHMIDNFSFEIEVPDLVEQATIDNINNQLESIKVYTRYIEDSVADIELLMKEL